MVEIADVDPTPIHHPVDNEALETAVNETAEQVADVAKPYAYSKEEYLAQRQPRKRIRRAGKVEISSDNRTFRTLVEQAPACALPPVG